jgi:hypothetical protein
MVVFSRVRLALCVTFGDACPKIVPMGIRRHHAIERFARARSRR